MAQNNQSSFMHKELYGEGRHRQVHPCFDKAESVPVVASAVVDGGVSIHDNNLYENSNDVDNDETSDDIPEELVEEFFEELENIPIESKSEYICALLKVPDIVHKESNPVIFLRYADYDPVRAAKALCDYWRQRVQNFGLECTNNDDKAKSVPIAAPVPLPVVVDVQNICDRTGSDSTHSNKSYGNNNDVNNDDGISDDIREELIECFFQELEKIPIESKSEYVDALLRAPDIVHKESNPVIFLRHADYDPARAAKALCDYWRQRVKRAQNTVVG